MQTVSTLYNTILANTNHYFEVSLVIGENGRLITRQNETLLFGGTAILVSRGGGDSGYQESEIIDMSITNGLFSEDKPSIGNAISAEINVTMIKPTGDIPRMAQLVPFVRVTDGTNVSEWVQKGVFFLDTRSSSNVADAYETITLHGYDTMLLADQIYDNSQLSWDASDINVVNEIATKLGVSIDPRTIALMNKGYMINYPANYTMRETLAYIAAAYGGNFIINEVGQLRLVALWDLPTETRYLIDNLSNIITFGGDRILV